MNNSVISDQNFHHTAGAMLQFLNSFEVEKRKKKKLFGKGNKRAMHETSGTSQIRLDCLYESS